MITNGGQPKPKETKQSFVDPDGQQHNEEAGEDFAIGPSTLEQKGSSLKTLIPSRFIKVSNIFDREQELTP